MLTRSEERSDETTEAPGTFEELSVEDLRDQIVKAFGVPKDFLIPGECEVQTTMFEGEQR